jgi:DNA-directed RNA polymerase specialized sigma24 family protein
MKNDSVSIWLDGVKGGDGRDIQRLWDRYFERIVRLAGSRLPGHARRAFDEEDVALSAFRSFCDRAGRGQFPRLSDRDDLWRVLSTITVRKVVRSVRYQTRLKRGGGRVMGESAVMGSGEGGAADEGLASFLGDEPTPQEAAEFADEYERLFGRLDDPALRTIALRKLEGFSSEEIASELGVTSRTVDRKLRLVRALWESDTGGESGPPGSSTPES